MGVGGTGALLYRNKRGAHLLFCLFNFPPPSPAPSQPRLGENLLLFALGSPLFFQHIAFLAIKEIVKKKFYPLMKSYFKNRSALSTAWFNVGFFNHLPVAATSSSACTPLAT